MFTYKDIIIYVLFSIFLAYIAYKHLKSINAFTWQNLVRQILDDTKWPISVIMIQYALNNYQSATGWTSALCFVCMFGGSRLYWLKWDASFIKVD